MVGVLITQTGTLLMVEKGGRLPTGEEFPGERCTVSQQGQERANATFFKSEHALTRICAKSHTVSEASEKPAQQILC